MFITPEDNFHLASSSQQGMNARLLAEEGCIRYMELVDETLPHTQNVSVHLRGIIVPLTKKILCAGNYHTIVSHDSFIIDENTKEDKSSPSSSSDNNDKIDTSGLSRRSIARMEAFLRACVYAIADEPIVHRRRSNTTSSFRKQSSNSPAKTINSRTKNKKSVQCYRQFEISDIKSRLELYCRSLKRVNEYEPAECVIALESTKFIKARADILVRSFVQRADSVRSVRPLLTNLLCILSMEILAVDAIPDSSYNSDENLKNISTKNQILLLQPSGSGILAKAIRKIVSDYEHTTSFASLAFLSSPEEAAYAHLHRMTISFIEFLRSDWRRLVAECELESMLAHSLNPNLRKTFKRSEFQSIGHLLKVCQSMRTKLEHIELPPIVSDVRTLITKTQDAKEVKQALKDLRREIITVNGHIIPPANSISELAQFLAESMHVRTVRMNGGGHSSSLRKKNKLRSSSSSRPNSLSSDVVLSDSGGSGSDGISSGNEGDVENSTNATKTTTSDPRSSPLTTTSPMKKSSNSIRKRAVDYATVDRMTCRLLIAAGRSGTGGDSYFVVRDLFGGEGVIVVPSCLSNHQRYHRAPTANSTNVTNKLDRRSSNPMYYRGGKMAPATIEINVRLTSVVIKIHANYDVFPEGASGVPEEYCEPLIQLHTTTTEIISLQEVRVRDALSYDLDVPTTNSPARTLRKSEVDVASTSPRRNSTADTRSGNDNIYENDHVTMDGVRTMVLREKLTPTTGKRILSIRPAEYKKVEVWDTFS